MTCCCARWRCPGTGRVIVGQLHASGVDEVVEDWTWTVCSTLHGRQGRTGDEDFFMRKKHICYKKEHILALLDWVFFGGMLEISRYGRVWNGVAKLLLDWSAFVCKYFDSWLKNKMTFWLLTWFIISVCYVLLKKHISKASNAFSLKMILPLF